MLKKKNTPGNAVARITLLSSLPPVRWAHHIITGTDSASRITVIVAVDAEIPLMISGPAPHEVIDTNAAISGNFVEAPAAST
jgi:hypothetical protein